MACSQVENMKGLVRNKLGLVIACVCVLLFFIALLVPVKYIPLDTTQDKYHHGFFFFGLTILLHFCSRLRLWILCIFLLILASVSELSQMLAPQRSSNWQDLKADFYGIAAAFLTILFIILIRRTWRLKKDAKDREKRQLTLLLLAMEQ